MRTRDERRVAENRGAAKRHVRDFQIVDRLQERHLAQANHVVELRRQYPFGILPHRGDHLARDQRRRNRERVRAPRIVGQQPRQFALLARGPIPDEIVAPVSRPQIVVRSRHRIAEHLLVVG